MPNVWNIGNTTIRNPNRIEIALKVFVEEGFSGNAKGSIIEANLHKKLKERDVLEYEGEPSDWNGRKWRAAFYQLGFISYEKYFIGSSRVTTKDLFKTIDLPEIKSNYELTPAGNKLINVESIPEIEEIYTRQFACYELPNALERSFPEGTMKPFILFLQILQLLQNSGCDGLNKFETGLFLQKFRNHTADLPQLIVDEIIEYRRLLGECSTYQEKGKLKKRYKENLRMEIGIDPDTPIKDYSDTTFRYFSLSGMFSRIGNTIVIRSNKFAFVKALLTSEPNFLYATSPTAYFNAFYKNSFPLPTDEKEFALKEISVLKEGIRDRTNPLLETANALTARSDFTNIQKIRFKLIEYNNWEREEDFANEQQTDHAIVDILRYLRVLNGERVGKGPQIEDRPAYLEWAVWRSFLAIDEIRSPVQKTRRFPIDQDFLPRNTAPGGGSDLLFEFESYVLVVEVTLTTSNRQMAVESEPVKRHTAQYKELYPDKDVYCLFIAPSVDNNVAEAFRSGVWYNGDEEMFVNIVPMCLGDFINAFRTLTTTRYRNSDFKTLMDRCLVFRNVRAPQWQESISSEVTVWRDKFVPTV